MKYLSVDPGDYPFTTTLDSERAVLGSVELRESAPTRGTLVNVPPASFQDAKAEAVSDEQVVINFNPSRKLVPEIRGVLFDGREVILRHVAVLNFDIGKASFSARHAFVGVQISREVTEFEKVRFQLSGLTHFSGVAPLIPRRSRSLTTPPDDSFALDWNPESTQRWTVGEDEIRLSFDYSAATEDPFRFHVTPAPVVTVVGPSREPEKWLEEYVRPLRAIVEFATVGKCGINWIKFFNSHQILDQTVPVTAQYFASNVLQVHELSEEPDIDSIALMRAGPDGVDLGEVLTRWRQREENRATFFELFTQSDHTNLPPRAQFLTYIPALESLHAAKIGQIPPSATSYPERRAKVLTEAKIRGFEKNSLAWLDRNIFRRREYALHERLRGLAQALPDDFRRQLPSDLRELSPELRAAASGDIWQLMTRVRNDLAHGGRQWSGSEIAPLIRLGRTLGTAHLLLELGASCEALTIAIRSGRWQVLGD